MTRGMVWCLRFFWPLVFYELAGEAVRASFPGHMWIAFFGGAVVSIPVFYAVWRWRQGCMVQHVPFGAEDANPETEDAAPSMSSVPSTSVPSKNGGLPKAAPQKLAFRFTEGFLLGVALNFVLIFTGLDRYAGHYEQAAAEMFSMPLMLQVLGTCIAAPMAEELMFRALAYGQLAKTWPAPAPAIVSALYFGAAHGNPAQGLYGFLMGLFLADSYEKDGLGGSFALHMGANAAGVVLALVFGQGV